jgi:hypothetical protein
VGPFRADQIRDGEPVELSNGRAIHCMTAGTRHGRAHSAGTVMLTIAAVAPEKTGVDVGIAWNDGKNLRAPDVSAGLDLQRPGWADSAPPLALEYADVGQDEDELAAKISELLELGTRVIWVVRLTGPLRVEVHEPGSPMRIVDADGTLTAPGILHDEVPVRALINPAVAVEAALHNLLAQKGYRSIEAIREEGHAAGLELGLEVARAQIREMVFAQIAARGWTVPPGLRERVAACADQSTMSANSRWP